MAVTAAEAEQERRQQQQQKQQQQQQRKPVHLLALRSRPRSISRYHIHWPFAPTGTRAAATAATFTGPCCRPTAWSARLLGVRVRLLYVRVMNMQLANE